MGFANFFEGNGAVFHIFPTSQSRYEKVIIEGKTIEITVFDGYFENMMTDHQEVACTVIAIGHYIFDVNEWFDINGIITAGNKTKNPIIGVTYYPKFNINLKTEELLEAILDEYKNQFQIINYKQINNRVMNSTQELCINLNYLKKAIADSVSREYVVYEDADFNPGPITANKEMQIIVSKERTYEAAEKYKGKRICCLDFANNHSVGGAPWHAGAQEESMCRTSTLYPCLCAKEKDFYKKHIEEFGAGKIDNMGSNDLIYIPDVVVFKTDESVPKLMPEVEWFNTDVIVAAAPQLHWGYDEKRYKELMTSRIKRILDVAAKEKVEVLILGAFGCGAFQNPPEIVAEIFASLIKNYNFETVEFAIFCRNDTKNYDIFREKLC